MKAYSFDISLSILNHLGRNLYRSFITVLGEAISNAWDADACNVYINIDKDNDSFTIRDDGDGMDETDFQEKFLKIGYSKRKAGKIKSTKNRPYIGRKGIGKLALLSCAKTITVLSKKNGSLMIGGVIDNAGLDEAIKDDVSSNNYQLQTPTDDVIKKYGGELENGHGTIIIFDIIKQGIRNRVEYIRKMIALCFRFSLLDKSFNIYINNVLVTIEELKDLIDNTQFIWTIGDCKDPLAIEKIIKSDNCKKNKNIEEETSQYVGFIASVDVPSHIKIRGTDERLTIDLYVNGRLREKDILKHIGSPRIVSNYVYGQIHFDSLDDGTDRFTSSREGVVSDDPKFAELIKFLDKVFKIIIEDWDKWRLEINQEGDSENDRIKPKERKAKALFDEIASEYIPAKSSDARDRVKKWVYELSEDAKFNLTSYGECFVSENLIRKYITNKGISLNEGKKKELEKYRKKAEEAKGRANISFEIRENDDDLSYFGMDDLSYIAQPDGKGDLTKSSFYRDSLEYKPIRDAMAHTARLTSTAKSRLSITYENIKAKVSQLLAQFSKKEEGEK